jgi:hypothetical protein
MNEQPDFTNFYQGQYSAHPHCPIAVWDFWVEELMLNHKYIVVMLDTPADKMTRWLARQVHLLCIVGEDAAQQNFIEAHIIAQAEEQKGNMRNISLLQGNSHQTNISNDSIDFAVVGQNWLRQPNREAIRLELQRILRLNSYVSLVLHKIKLTGNAFADAYAQLLHQYNLSDDYQHLPNEDELKDFFANHYALNAFSNQLRFNADTWRIYIEHSHYFQAMPPERRSLFLRAAKLLFMQQAQGGELLLDCDTHVYTSIFNKYTPAISLRKSIFFQLLRPFAFCFYVLVKMNVYFWRMIYKLRYLLPRRK